MIARTATFVKTLNSFVRTSRLWLAVPVLGIAISACGGGGGSSRAIPSTASTTASAAAATTTAPVTVTLAFARYTPVMTSSSYRRPAFVSPATGSVRVSVLTVDGGTPATPSIQTFDTTPGSTSCASSGGSTTCSFSANVPVGTVDVLQVQTFSGAGGTGTILGSAVATASVRANAQNVVQLSVGGVAASLDVVMVHSQLPVTGGTSLLVVIPLDGSGAQIVNPGAYAAPITVTSSDPHFLLITNGGPPATNATITSPGDQVVVQFDGRESSGAAATITASASGVSASAVVSAGSAPISINASGASSPGLTFTNVGQSSTVNINGGSGSYTAVSSATSIATVSGGGSSYVVAAGGFGSTTITFRDGSGTLTMPVTVVPPAIVATPTSRTNVTSPGTFHYAFAQNNGSLTLALTGGTAVYAATMASSGTGSSAIASVTQSGSSLTVTPVGPGTDFIIVTSGNIDALIQIDVSLQPLTLTPAAVTNAQVTNSAIALDGSGSVAALSVSGGNGVYAVPTGCESHVSISGSSPTFNLTNSGVPGTCTLTVRDSAGTSGTIVVTTTASPSLSPAGPIMIAFGGSTTETIAGGIGSFTATATNSLSVSVSGTALTINANHSGASVVTVKDSLGVAATISVNVSAPLSAALTIVSGKGSVTSSTMYLAAGSVGKITPSNGTQPYALTNDAAAACGQLSAVGNPSINPLNFQITETNSTPTAGSCGETVGDAASGTVAVTITVVALLTNGTPTNATIGAPVAGLTNINASANGSVVTVPLVGGKSAFSIDQQPDSSIVSSASISGGTLSFRTTTTSGRRQSPSSTASARP